MKDLGDSGAAQTSERYDRQLRIWGDRGQARLRDATILVLGCSSTAIEALRNLVLPGVGRFALVDDSKVLLSDLSENFLVSPEDIGAFKCRSVCKRTSVLNPAVYGEAWAISPHDYLKYHAQPAQDCSSSKHPLKALRFSFSSGQCEAGEYCPPPVCKFDLVIASAMPTEDERELLRICGECGIKRLSSVSGRADGISLGPALEKVPSHRWEFPRQVPVVSLGALGFFGWVRLWAGEYCLVDRKPESSPVDLRIANPFPELLEFASRFDLEAMDDEHHSHVPFIVILLQAVCRYRRVTLEEASVAISNGDLDGKFSFPLPHDARKKIHDIVIQMRRSEQETNFQEAIDNIYRAVQPAVLSDEIAEIIEKASTMPYPPTPFWCLARALHKMFRSLKALPVCPLTMDMTADTSSYVGLQRVYAEKAARDEQMVKGFLLEEGHFGANQLGGASDSIIAHASREELQCFCRNAANIKVIRYPEAEENLFGTASLKLLRAAVNQMRRDTSEAHALDVSEECGHHHIPWYATVLACKLAADKLGRFPGSATAIHPQPQQQPAMTSDRPTQDESDLQTDLEAVKAEVRTIEREVGSGLSVSDDIIKQIVAYRGSEFPTTAALIGGVAAQETIKLLCKQFEPINNTFLWNGTERRGIMLEL